MKFHEAAPKMNPGDIFRATKDGMSDIILKNKGYFCNKAGTQISLNVIHFNLEGEIIPAEPKVLSESELFGKIMALDEYGCHTVFNRQWLSDVIDLCHQNGRLERDLELRPAIKKAFEICSVKNHPLTNSIALLTELDDEIQNLPPLNKNEPE
jgi:hypothetical protein